MTDMLLGIHQPGDTWLHRLAVGPKLTGLLLASIAVVAFDGPPTVVIELAFALAVATSARIGWSLLYRSLRGLALVLIGLGSYLLWRQSFDRAMESVGDLVTLVLLATTLTVTTPVDEVLDGITRELRWLHHFGVSPDTVALAFSIMLRSIPTTLRIADETRDAAIARGLERDPRARLIPIALRVVAHARATGEALYARGIHD